MTSTLKNILTGIFGLCLLANSSCKKFVQVGNAPDKLPTATIFADSADAVGALSGIYSGIMNNSSSISSMVHGQVTLYTGITCDELIPTSPIPELNQVYTNAMLNNNSIANGLWRFAYKTIYQTNACIEGITASPGLSNNLKNQLTGESRFCRALIYFHLVNLFGGIPVITTTDYRVNAILPRASADSVYKLVISDLLSAKQLLANEYPSAGRVRPNRAAASAFLAKVYLYKQQWDLAEAEANEIISNPSYSLEADLNRVFLAGSSEAILQLLPAQAGFETAEGTTFVPTQSNVIPPYRINNFLLNAFDAGDARKINWLKSNTVNGQEYYYPYKYKLGQDNNSSPVENYMMFRLGEQYLIRAEAEAQQNKTTEALADLNMIRQRASLPDASAATTDELLAAIYHERQIELFCELGNRWYDLKRTGTVTARMNMVCPAKPAIWDDHAQLFPIPFDQINANPFLTQNPGYN